MPDQSWTEFKSALTADSKKSPPILNTQRVWTVQIDSQRYEGITKFQLLKLIKKEYNKIIYVYMKDKFFSAVNGSDNCQCGRTYKDKQGNIFAERGTRLESYGNEYTFRKFLQTPALCKHCYYQKEHLAGRWAPKVILKELGLDIDN